MRPDEHSRTDDLTAAQRDRRSGDRLLVAFIVVVDAVCLAVILALSLSGFFT